MELALVMMIPCAPAGLAGAIFAIREIDGARPKTSLVVACIAALLALLSIKTLWGDTESMVAVNALAAALVAAAMYRGASRARFGRAISIASFYLAIMVTAVWIGLQLLVPVLVLFGVYPSMFVGYLAFYMDTVSGAPLLTFACVGACIAALLHIRNLSLTMKS